jgi:thymidine phosphorylase
MDAKLIGLSLVGLGGGRKRPDEAIDLSVGITDFAQIGDEVGSRRPLCVIHARDEAGWDGAAERIRAAIRVGAERGAPPSIIKERLARRP